MFFAQAMLNEKKTVLYAHPSVCLFLFQKYAIEFNETDDLLNVVIELRSSTFCLKAVKSPSIIFLTN
jgi:hypothetical protein